ncbi:hypothetical protein CXU22_09525 [Akkermansia muciniphila]|uniref:Uncharacterized protein n=1 Tax=Akkermansia muciniphila TaxID=239935 RepID=A0A2N8HAK8_9BACT|nr:hypothetical protein CXU22_09525 [Akkermansia muciniphila]
MQIWLKAKEQFNHLREKKKTLLLILLNFLNLLSYLLKKLKMSLRSGLYKKIILENIMKDTESYLTCIQKTVRIVLSKFLHLKMMKIRQHTLLSI